MNSSEKLVISTASSPISNHSWTIPKVSITNSRKTFSNWTKKGQSSKKIFRRFRYNSKVNKSKYLHFSKQSNPATRQSTIPKICTKKLEINRFYKKNTVYNSDVNLNNHVNKGCNTNSWLNLFRTKSLSCSCN